MKPIEFRGTALDDLRAFPQAAMREAGTFRVVYVAKLADAVFVLHCFQKKSKRGIATPKADMDIVHARLKIAEAFVKELRK